MLHKNPAGFMILRLPSLVCLIKFASSLELDFILPKSGIIVNNYLIFVIFTNFVEMSDGL
jgi:hypothetical protein